MKMINERFGLDFKRECIMFKFKNSTYKIPSKVYPLNGRKFSIFTSENTTELENKEVEKLFDMCKFQVGKCYLNAEMLKQGAEHLNIKGLTYYSGWVFMGCLPPMNHAWIVYNNKSILDGSTLRNQYLLFENKDKNTLSKKDCAIILKNEIDSNKPNHEKFCYGKTIIPMIYIGCEDTYNHSRVLLKKALDVTKDKHPSYVYNNGLNPYGNSELQNIIRSL